jgi:hypothetical protein
MLTISPTHSVLLREGAPGVVAWDPNQQGKRDAKKYNIAIRPVAKLEDIFSALFG